MRQGYYGGDSADYSLPNEMERPFIFSYLGNTKDTSHLLSSFVDSTRQIARLTLNVADIGTTRMEQLLNKLTPKIYAALDTSKYSVTVTGASVIFLEGNRYIIEGLTSSLLLAFVLIAVCMGYLFRSWRMIIFSHSEFDSAHHHSGHHGVLRHSVKAVNGAHFFHCIRYCH